MLRDHGSSLFTAAASRLRTATPTLGQNVRNCARAATGPGSENPAKENMELTDSSMVRRKGLSAWALSSHLLQRWAAAFMDRLPPPSSVPSPWQRQTHAAGGRYRGRRPSRVSCAAHGGWGNCGVSVRARLLQPAVSLPRHPSLIAPELACWSVRVLIRPGGLGYRQSAPLRAAAAQPCCLQPHAAPRE